MTQDTTDKIESECLEPSCDSDANYVAESPDGVKVAVCYKHSLQFAPAKVHPLGSDDDQ